MARIFLKFPPKIIGCVWSSPSGWEPLREKGSFSRSQMRGSVEGCAPPARERGEGSEVGERGKETWNRGGRGREG